VKVLVLYENTGESDAAAVLAVALNKIGSMLCNSTIEDTLGGQSLRINAGPLWKVNAVSSPLEALGSRNPFSPTHSQPKPKRGQRALIFEEDV
jgi:hypothetical protein